MLPTLDRLREALAGRYTIERQLGRGGMATVYLAEDLKHRRQVAIKVLHPELAATLGPDRFLREIQIAARLTHPHILGLHDSGDAAGLLYYVMPYVEGETVADRLLRDGPLPLVDAIGIVRDVADALGYAHEKGVVHRDIKPANILWSRGHAMVADFGIARAVMEAGEESVTSTGLVVGTPAYMSPEQISGSGRIDGRSDIYSLGCVLFEMLVGHAPFDGGAAWEIVSRHMSNQPPSVRAARPDLPETIDGALARAMAKAPADRYSSARAFLEGLTTAAPSEVRPVVVAPPLVRDRFWTDPNTRHGAFHETARFADGVPSDLLVVFVHGLFGDRFNWRDLPELVVRESGVDADVLSFEYPAGLLHETSVETAAGNLRAALDTTYAPYHHLLFVADGSGALVLKRALIDDLRERSEVFAAHDQALPSPECLVCRTRRVVQITTPRRGGAPFWSVARVAYQLFSVLARPLIVVVNALAGARFRFGRNLILTEVDEKNPRTAATESDYRRIIEACDRALLPRPLTVELTGVKTEGPARVEVSFPGERESRISGPAHVDADVTAPSQSAFRPKGRRVREVHADEIARHVRVFGRWEDAAVARLTVERAYELDRFESVRELVSAARGGRESRNSAAQTEIAARIIRLAGDVYPEPLGCVVTGETGVGKSVLLRRVSRVAALDYLRRNGSNSLPVTVILQQITLSRSDVAEIVEDKEGGRRGWMKIASSWCSRVDELLEEDHAAGSEQRRSKPRIGMQWLEQRLAKYPTLLILDGIDEFITNHPGITLEHVRDVVSYLRTRFRSNGRLVIVSAVQTGVRHLESLASTPAQVYVVPRLTEDQAAGMFPDAVRLLDQVKNDRSRALLFTPLILSELGPLAIKDVDHPLSSFELTEIALNSILHRSGIASQRDSAGRLYPDASWRAALAFLAWTFFRANRGEASVQPAVREALDVGRAWKAAVGGSDHVDAGSFADGVQILEDQVCCHFLLTRTIFHPSAQTSVRFRHRHWEDFLAALCLGWAVRHRHAVGLGERAFTDSVFELSVDFLQDASIDLETVTKFVSATLDTRNELVIGNFTALLGDSFLGVTEEALGQGLLGRLAELPPLAQYGIVVSLGYRAIRRENQDHWAHVVRAVFRKYLADDGLARAIVQGNPVIVSAIWCYLALLHQRYQMPRPTSPWRPLSPADGEGLLYTRTETGAVSTGRQRSIQNAFVDYQLSVLGYSDKAIKAMHHLLIVVSAFAAGAGDAGVEKALPQVFNNSELERAVLRYSEVPVVAQIWDTCKTATATRS